MKKAIEFLTAEKPADLREANMRISEYVKKCMLPYCFGHNVEIGIIKFYPKEGAYIRITSSGNEPKLYASIQDTKTGEPILVNRILDSSPAAYGQIATITGAYMEALWLYMDINDL